MMHLTSLEYRILAGIPTPCTTLRRTARPRPMIKHPSDGHAPFGVAGRLDGKPLDIPLDATLDSWDRITPDPAGEDPIYLASARFVLPSRLEIEKRELRAAWNYQHTMARLYGIYSAEAQRAAADFAAMFAARSFARGGAL